MSTSLLFVPVSHSHTSPTGFPAASQPFPHPFDQIPTPTCDFLPGVCNAPQTPPPSLLSRFPHPHSPLQAQLFGLVYFKITHRDVRNGYPETCLPPFSSSFIFLFLFSFLSIVLRSFLTRLTVCVYWCHCLNYCICCNFRQFLVSCLISFYICC